MWKFKVGKRYQITIRKIAPLLDLKVGDWVSASFFLTSENVVHNIIQPNRTHIKHHKVAKAIHIIK